MMATRILDPFRIDGPTCISFSGGRTSAYMLWRVLQSNNGLPQDAVVCFANTGKEDEATLRFVRDCGQQWNVPIFAESGDSVLHGGVKNPCHAQTPAVAGLGRRRSLLGSDGGHSCG
jgi:3'-phosphoadenosine 5'-phosphosulfate sulfotransferase (PAPS reductase)/FAD synthetase